MLVTISAPIVEWFGTPVADVARLLSDEFTLARVLVQAFRLSILCSELRFGPVNFGSVKTSQPCECMDFQAGLLWAMLACLLKLKMKQTCIYICNICIYI